MEAMHCEICRAPASAMPCARCIFPSPVLPNRPRKGPKQSRPATPFVLDGKYRLLEEVGRGGMGTVFRAVDETLEREVAIKFLLPEVQRIPEMVERFRKEAKAMAAINHDNVVKIFSYGQFGDADFLVTEFIEGRTLEEVIDATFKRRTQLELPKALHMLDQAAAGLSAVHRAQVVHRDVKPGNVMVDTQTERVVIMDFGIGHQPVMDGHSKTILPGGTPAYMAPEIISGGRIDPTKEYLADIYALGVTAFETLTNSLPFDGKNWVKVLNDHLETPPPPPSYFRPELPSSLDALVVRALAKKPEQRFQSAAAFRQALLPLLRRYGVVNKYSGFFESQAIEGFDPRGMCGEIRVVVASLDPLFREAVFKAAKEVSPDAQVLSARSNAFALELIDASPRQVLVASLDDPRLNGIELAAELMSNPHRASIRLVLASESFSAAESALLERLDVDAQVELPVGHNQLVSLLEGLFERVCSVDDEPTGEFDSVIIP